MPGIADQIPVYKILNDKNKQHLRRGLKSTFPNVKTLLRMYQTIPISNESEKLTLSAVKTHLQNFNGVYDIFGKMKCRKKVL